MSFMENIRSKGQGCLIAFLVVFVITLFFGLTGGFSIFTPSQRQPGKAPAGGGTLVKDKGLEGAALLVNGEAVSTEIYDDIVRRLYENIGRGQKDESMRLEAYGYAVNILAGQQVTLQQAAKLGIKLGEKDFQTEKSEIAANYMKGETKSGGSNVIGDMFKNADKLRAEKSAFIQYLSTTGLTEKQWEAQVRRELLAQKVQDEMTSRAEDEEKAELDQRKAEVDAELAKGKSFADAADQFNDDKGQSGTGGDMGWIGWGLLTDEKQRDAIFATEKGKTTDWIEVDAGWQKFEVYDKKAAEGEEFEKQKTSLRQTLLDQHKDDPDYKPTDEEIAQQYEQVALRQIMLRKNAAQKASEELDKLVQEAKIEINNAYALAYQALKADKLQPPAARDYDALVKLAQTAAIGEGYDFSLIKAKLERGQSEPAKAGEANADEAATEEPEAGETAADSAAPAGETAETAAPAEEAAPDAPAAETPAAEAEGAAAAEPPVDEVNMSEAALADPSAPIYALGIGLLEQGITDENGQGEGAFAHYMIAKTYLDWMADTERLTTQPINRDKAREAIELHLGFAVKSDNYNSMAYAMRGLNLAWMEKKTESYEALDQARKYASDTDEEVWNKVREAYEVFDDKTKLDEVDAKLRELRQKQLQEMINRQMQQSTKEGAVPPGAPPTPPPAPPAAGGQ